MDENIVELLAARAHRDGGSLAYAGGRSGEVVTWQDLAERLQPWARAPLAGVVAALMIERPLAFVDCYLGLLAAGAVVLPLDPGAAAREAAATLTGFEASFLVTDTELGREVAALAGVPAWAPNGPVPAGGRPVAWCEPATVLLRTSGTTGAPKGVPLTVTRLLHGARAVAGHHGLGPGEILYSPLPLFHVNAEVTGVLAALVAGSTLVVDPRFSRAGFWATLDRWGVTLLNAVPAILALLAREEPPAPPVAARIRFARSASSPLPAATRERFEAHCGIGVLETYGMTEAAGQICANPLDPSARRAGSVGYPVGLSLRVTRPDGSPSPVGEAGRVQIAGPPVVDHYLLPADPASGTPVRPVPAADAAGWLTTGDHGVLDASGALTLVGRADGVINRGGEKIYPRELEEVLRRHPGVAEVVVVGEPDPVLGEHPVAFIVPAAGCPAPAGLADELLALCRRELARARQPARFEFRDSLPATATGKVRREALKASLAPAGTAT